MLAVRDIEAVPHERRRHQRVKVALLGRCMLEDRKEYRCQTLDMSPGGVALLAPVAAARGERVIAYLDHIGRIEGIGARPIPGGFALALNVTAGKRDKLADQLTWLANRLALGLPEDRRHDRIVPVRRLVEVHLGTTRFQAVLIDVSVSGCALRTDVAGDLGAAIRVGDTDGTVVRRFADGIAVEFSRPLPPKGFGDHVVL